MLTRVHTTRPTVDVVVCTLVSTLSGELCREGELNFDTWVVKVRTQAHSYYCLCPRSHLSHTSSYYLSISLCVVAAVFSAVNI